MWLLDERSDIISYNCIELLWYCVWLDHQQTSNHICLQVAYGRGRPTDYCIYRRWRWTVKICKQLGCQEIWQCVTRCVCEDWSRPTSRSFATLPYNWYHQVVRKTCFSSTHLSSENFRYKGVELISWSLGSSPTNHFCTGS